MKTHIKHLACLVLLSITPFVAMGQIAIDETPLFPAVKRSLIRTLNPSRHIVVKNCPYATFSYVDYSTMQEYTTSLSGNIIVNDFEIIDDYVLFCGIDGGGYACTGWFNVKDLLFNGYNIYITSHSLATSPYHIHYFRKMDVYKVGNEYHIVAIGMVDDAGTAYPIIGDITIDMSTNTVVHTNYQIRTTRFEVATDITATDNFVVVVTINRRSYDQYTIEYEKPMMLGSDIFSTTNVFTHPMHNTNYIAEYIKGGVFVTDIGGDRVATIIPYKNNSVLLTFFSCNPTALSVIGNKYFIYLPTVNLPDLRIEDFTYSTPLGQLIILSYDNKFSQISMLDNITAWPSLIPSEYEILSINLQSAGIDPINPRIIFSGYNSISYLSNYVLYDLYSPSVSTCATSQTIHIGNTIMEPILDTVYPINATIPHVTNIQITAPVIYIINNICY